MSPPDQPSGGRRRHLWSLVLLGIGVGGIGIGSGLYAWQAGRIDHALQTMAHERARALFDLTSLAWDWNVRHQAGGIPPELPINPAQMVHEIGDLARPEGLRLSVTSLAPLDPDNAPDAWEAESLRLLSEGRVGERLSFFPDPEPVYRFMAPVSAKASCVTCHGDRVGPGGVMGGISITMPAQGLLAVAATHKKEAATLLGLGTFGIVTLAGLAVVQGRRVVVAWHERRALERLTEAHRLQDNLIAARTEQLSSVNAALLEEVAKVQAVRREVEESEARVRAVLESSQDGIMMVQEGKIILANGRLCKISGYSQNQLMDLPPFGVIAPEDRGWMAALHERRLRGEVVPVTYRCHLLHRDGVTRRSVDVSVVVRPWGGEGPVQVVVSFRDVTEKLAAERDLQIAGAVFDHTAEGIIVTGVDNRIVRVNPAFTAITGYGADEVIGRDPMFLRSGRHDKVFFDQMWSTLRETGRWEGEVWNRRKNGDIFVEWLHIVALPQDEENQGGYVATFSDITRRKAAEEVILHQATYDALTDLPNRRLFDDRLDVTLASAQRHGRQFALMYVDLDHFKAVNDTLGHAAGDTLLSEAARRMVGCVRGTDTVARLGGDEFAVILTDLDGFDRVEEVARRVRLAVDQPFFMSEGEARVSASLGVALYPKDGVSAADLRRAADRALYAAKAAGRNIECFAS